uniref:Uncharacterized protein n=1 Tax=Rhizophora mucronata TaxID=61149 RepID=A0A2P2MCA6_RHIMU
MIGETHGQRMHSLMDTALHHQQRVLSQQVGYRARVVTFKQLPFILQNEPVRLWVGGEHGRFTKHMGRENWTEPLNAFVDERLGIFALVCRYQLESFADQRKAETPRRNP